MGEVFAAGSVSLRLYPHNELSAAGVVDELCGQALLGIDSGFDGVMLSEHHGGFAGYLPNPLQMTTMLLETCTHGWVAPCPLLLPLRPTAMVAEEIAWLSARHPGRVGLGVASGALRSDFDAMGVPFGDAVPRFKEELPRLVAMLRGEDLRELANDPALRECAAAPVPVLSAAVSSAAARRAAASGAGLVLEGMSTVERLAAVCGAHRDAGGTQPIVLIRRVRLGSARTDLVEQQRAVYASYSTGEHVSGDDQTVATADPDRMAEVLMAASRDTGATALNLRVHLPGFTPADVRDQIMALGEQVLPRLRALQSGGVA